MKLDLTKAQLIALARGCIMLEKSIGRKMKDGDISAEMSGLLTREQAEIYKLRQQIVQGAVYFDNTEVNKKP